MEEFLKFKKMITPIIIPAILWIGTALCVLSGLVQILNGAFGDGRGGHFLTGFVTLLVGPIIVRVYCEILIVLFSINDTLTEIRDNTRGMSGPKN